MGAEYPIDIEATSKPRAEYRTDEWAETDLPCAPAIMIGEEVVAEGSYRVSGQALPGSSVMVNGRRARVDEGGGFSALVPLTPGENRIDVTAIAPGGVTTGAQRRVKYQLP